MGRLSLALAVSLACACGSSEAPPRAPADPDVPAGVGAGGDPEPAPAGSARPSGADGSSSPEPARASSHCGRGETAVFDCALAGGERLSVCAWSASGDAAAAPDQVQVRLGPAGEPRLTYPERGTAGLTLSRYTRPQVTYLVLAFEHDGGRYEVFDDDDHGQTARGLRRVPAGDANAGAASERACAGPVTGSLLALDGVVESAE